MSSKISRRDFLKEAAVGAVGLSMGGVLSACSKDTSGAAETTEGITTPVAAGTYTSDTKTISLRGNDTTYGSYLNPQEDFTGDNGDYSALFEPLTIGHVTLKSRIGKSCAGSELQKSKETVSGESLGFYEEFCKGGVGMICYEPSTLKFDPTSGKIPLGDGVFIDASFVSMDLYDDSHIEAHKIIPETTHKYGVPVIAQMIDMMMVNGGGGAYSEGHRLETSFNPGIIQPIDSIHESQKMFIDGAVRYYKAGFDGVEINCSCNHYFSTFLSRVSNNERTDEYGGQSLENRARVVTEIIKGIRKEVGQNFIIQVLYSGIEDNVANLGDSSNCISIEEAQGFAKLFEEAGASCLHIRTQAYGHHCGGFMPDMFHYFEHGDTGYSSVIDYGKHFGGQVLGKYGGYGAFIDVASKIKEAVSIPVGTVGCMDPRAIPDIITKAIKDGKIDYMLMTRVLMADPHISNKLKEGKRDEIAPCTHCMTCFVAPFGLGMPMYCRVNAAISRAYEEEMPEGYNPMPVSESKKVMIIGGGPAGMEAARIAAQRGHAVTLYEKSSELGGKMTFVQQVKGPHERIIDHRNYLIRQLEVNNVAVKLNTDVTLDLVKSEAPDIVIAAVGGVASTLDVTKGNGVMTLDDVNAQLASRAELSVGDNVVVIGAQFQACETVAHLVRQGKRVTVINPGSPDELWLNGAVWTSMQGRYWLMGKGVRFYHLAQLKEVRSNSVTFMADYGEQITIDCDNVIQALPLQTNRSLFDSLVGVVSEAYAVGDCYAPNNFANAIARANLIARQAGSGSGGAASTELTENQFRGTATGMGDVSVTITVDNGKISSAIVDTSNETMGIGKDLGEAFAQQISEKGDIDVVSGATVTSEAVKKALSEAKKKAGLN